MPITGAEQSTAILPQLPVDPLTGKRDSWVYDVLAPGLADSGAYKVTVRYSESMPLTQQRGR